MNLTEYLSDQNLTIREFAAKSRLSYKSIYNYEHNDHFPHLQTILRIYFATDGKIDIRDKLKKYLK